MVTTIKKLSQGYGYRYADLSAIHEELEKQGITYYQYTDYDQNADADYIYTVLRYGDDEETKPLRGCRVLMGGEKSMSVAQAQGSALTYARRYSLLMALGWATEDDDGANSGKTPAPKKTGGKISFQEVREKLAEIDNVEELNQYWTSLHLSENQANILKGDFAERKAKIGA